MLVGDVCFPDLSCQHTSIAIILTKSLLSLRRVSPALVTPVLPGLQMPSLQRDLGLPGSFPLQGWGAKASAIPAAREGEVGRAGMENWGRTRPASPSPAGRAGGMGLAAAAGEQSFPPVAATPTQQPAWHSAWLQMALIMFFSRSF